MTSTHWLKLIDYKRSVLALALSGMGLVHTPAQASLGAASASIDAMASSSSMQMSDMVLLSEIQRKTITTTRVYQSYYGITSELDDSDLDGTLESPAMKPSITGYTPPTGGGFIPDSSAGPKVDGYEMPLGYCAWDHGSDNLSANRIGGQTTPVNSDIVFAIISSGADRSFQTTCADSASGTLSGDDAMTVVTISEANMGVSAGENKHFKEPVTDRNALLSLDMSTSEPGEMRIVLDSGKTYSWLDLDSDGTYQWEMVSSYFYSSDSNGATAGGEYTSNPFSVGIGAKFSDRSVTPDSELEVDGTARFISGSGVVDTDGNAQVHIGNAVDAPGTVGEIARLAIQPFGHNGGPFNIYARDDVTTAFLDFRYGGLTTPSESLLTMGSAGGVGKVGILSPNPPSSFSVGGADDATQGPVMTLHGNAVNQFESGRVRFTEGDDRMTGAFMHYDGSNGTSAGRFHIGINNVVSMDPTNDINVLTIDRTGYVGLNNDVPGSTLHIRSADGPTADTEVIIESDQGNANESANPRLTLKQDGAQIEGQFGINGIADEHYLGAIANAVYLEGAGTSSGLGLLQFVTGRDASTPGAQGAARMTIDRDGYIGVGDTSPSNHLQVSQWTGNDGDYLLNLNEVRTDAGTSFYHQKSIGFSANDFMLAEIGTYGSTTDQSAASLDYLFFNVDSADIATGSTHATPDMVIKSTGNVGIQTIDPQAELDVNGTIRAEDAMKIGDEPVVDVTGRNAIMKAPEDLPVGWYTVATNGSSRASARFGLMSMDSGYHQSTVFYAAALFGMEGNINVISNDVYADQNTNPLIEPPANQIRIATGGTYDGALLQVYNNRPANKLQIAMLGDDMQLDGWDLVPWVPEGTDPGTVANFSTLTNHETVSLYPTARGGMSTTGGLFIRAMKKFGGDYPTQREDTTDSILLGSHGKETFQIFRQDSGTQGTFCGGANYHDCYIFMMSDNTGDNPDGDVLFGGIGGDDVFEPSLRIGGNNQTTVYGSTQTNYGSMSNVFSISTPGKGEAHFGALNGTYFHVNTNVSSGFYFYDEVRSAVGFVSSSDRRLKKDIAEIPDALDKLSKVRGVTYNWRSEEFPEMGLPANSLQHGVIAQEMESVFPSMVHTDDQGLKSVNYTQIIPVLIEATKELDQKNEDQDNELARHEQMLNDLKSKIRQHEDRLKSLEGSAPDESTTIKTEAPAAHDEPDPVRATGLGRFYQRG